MIRATGYLTELVWGGALPRTVCHLGCPAMAGQQHELHPARLGLCARLGTCAPGSEGAKCPGSISVSTDPEPLHIDMTNAYWNVPGDPAGDVEVDAGVITVHMLLSRSRCRVVCGKLGPCIELVEYNKCRQITTVSQSF